MTGSLARGLFSSNFCSGFVRDTFFSLHHWIRGGFIRMPVQLSLTVKCEHYHECSERCIFCLILRVTTRLLHKIILKIVMLWLAMSWTLPEFEKKRELNFRMKPQLCSDMLYSMIGLPSLYLAGISCSYHCLSKFVKHQKSMKDMLKT